MEDTFSSCLKKDSFSECIKEGRLFLLHEGKTVPMALGCLSLSWLPEGKALLTEFEGKTALLAA
jgi:hypothetical protein